MHHSFENKRIRSDQSQPASVTEPRESRARDPELDAGADQRTGESSAPAHHAGRRARGYGGAASAAPAREDRGVES